MLFLLLAAAALPFACAQPEPADTEFETGAISYADEEAGQQELELLEVKEVEEPAKPEPGTTTSESRK